jgi:periplasmic protein TonB
MFEKTFEAQALDASSAHFSQFSIAIGIHAAVAVVALGISFAIVPQIVEPDVPDQPITFIVEPREFKLENPGPRKPPAPKRGTDDPGPVVTPPRPTPPEVPPSTTPDALPEPPAVENETLGDGTGALGLPSGLPDGVPDGTGTSVGGPDGTGTGTGEPLDLTPEMVRPVLVHKVSPVYPDVPRKARLEGRVTVQAVIGLDGSVESVEILRTSNPLFNDAALAAVRQWRYRPATMNGVPVRVFFTVEVGFVLR